MSVSLAFVVIHGVVGDQDKVDAPEQDVGRKVVDLFFFPASSMGCDKSRSKVALTSSGRRATMHALR